MCQSKNNCYIMRLLKFWCYFIFFSSLFFSSTTAGLESSVGITPFKGYTFNPFWGPKNYMYFISKSNSTIIAYDDDTATDWSTTIVNNNDGVTFIIPIKDSELDFVVGLGSTLVTVVWNTTDQLQRSIPLNIESTINLTPSNSDEIMIAKTDCQSRLLVGTYHGNVYRVMPGHSVKLLNLTVGIPRGFAFDQQCTMFYRADSANTSVIVKHKYDNKQGEINSDGTVVFNFTDYGLDGEVGGIAMDTSNCLWVACFHTTDVIQIDLKTGMVLTTIKVDDDALVTSVAFGMPGLKSLFVTTDGNSWSMYKVDGTGSTGVEVAYFGL